MLLSVLSVAVAAAVLVAVDAGMGRPGAAWEHVGPRNIFDDKTNKGESGTLADAASPLSNPKIIYTGGANNGAASGILRSTDMGSTWQRASNGLFDTRILGVFLYPGTEDHVLAGTPTGVYESTDGANSWALIAGTEGFGGCRSFRNGTIDGAPSILGGCSHGIANVPAKGGTWAIIESPGSWGNPLSIADDGPTTVVCGCVSGVVVLGTITSRTGADWTRFPSATCFVAAIDPNDKDHFIFSNSTPGNFKVIESTDGGKSTHPLEGNVAGGRGLVSPWCFYVAIDRKGWYYTGAEAGAYRTMDGGKNWAPYKVVMQSRAGFNDTRVPHDYQRLSMDFAGGMAFPSDQGLFIAPSGDNVANLELINANGNLSNSITIHAAVSPGDGTSPGPYVVTTVWDWNVIASWDGGKSWPATPCSYWDQPNSCQGAPANIGEGGSATSIGMSNYVVLLHYHWIYHSSQGGKNTTALLLPPSAKDHDSLLVYTRVKGSRTEPDGNLFTVMTMDLSEAAQYTHALRPEDAPAEWNAPCMDKEGEVRKAKQMADEANGVKRSKLHYAPFGELRDGWRDGVNSTPSPSQEYIDVGREGDVQGIFVLKSSNYGKNWTWTQFPVHLSKVSVIAVNPVDASTIYAVSDAGIATSTTKGETWSPLMQATGLTTGLTNLVIKDSSTMLALRRGKIPLRTQDGGKTWAPLTDPIVAKYSTAGYSQSASFSWSGDTLELHGRDPSAPSRGEYAGFVIKSKDAGSTFTDETGNIVTSSVSATTWYQKDLYLTTSGEGILRKQDFDL